MQSNSNTVIIMHVASMTLCSLVVVASCSHPARQIERDKEEAKTRGREGSLRIPSSRGSGRKRNFARARGYNCIFARDAIDRSIEQSAKSCAFPRAHVLGRSGARTELTSGPLRSTRRKLWLKRSDRITRGVYRKTFIIFLFIRRVLTSFTNGSVLFSETTQVFFPDSLFIIHLTSFRKRKFVSET